MSADPTASERSTRYAAKMISKGMVQARVWVPTEADAEEIKRIAAEMRERAGENNRSADRGPPG